MKSTKPPAQEDDLDDAESESWLSGTKLYSALFVALFLLLYFIPSMVVIIPAGHAGVLYRPLHGGTYLGGNVPEGLTVISPINSITIYNLRLQEREETVGVLSSNGLTIDVSVSFRFAPMREDLPALHVLVGPDYDKKVIIPTVISSVREVVGKYLPEELYTTHRNTVQEEMNRDIRERLVSKHIYFETILIRSIRLPELINTAIENKLRQQQEFQEYEYRLKRETQEAARKRIEAVGWRDFQATVNENLTAEYLRWKWIDSMLALSRSNNAKVVVLGEGQAEKLPVSLPMFMSPVPTESAAGPAEPGGQGSGEGTAQTDPASRILPPFPPDGAPPGVGPPGAPARRPAETGAPAPAGRGGRNASGSPPPPRSSGTAGAGTAGETGPAARIGDPGRR